MPFQMLFSGFQTSQGSPEPWKSQYNAVLSVKIEGPIFYKQNKRNPEMQQK